MKKRSKYFSFLLIIIIVVSFSSFGIYEIQTEPTNFHTIGEKQGCEILHNCTNSEIKNVTLKAFGNSESLMMGTQTAGEVQKINPTIIVLTVVKTSQSVAFPYGSMSYTIKGANIYCDGFNNSVFSISEQNQENFTVYALSYSFQKVGNLSLIVYVNLAGIAESGIFHFTGNTYTVPIRVNITVYSV
ncbi:MAG: hypothetical protein ACYCR7_05040 [Thermoplasmataceae archaeon]